MFKLPQKILIDAERYRQAMADFLAGKITAAFFRGIRVPWGNYSQRGGKILMSRLRIPAGILTARQLKAIGEAAIKFADNQIHLTTRQDIQIHNVSYEKAIAIMDYLHQVNISPRGGGGNTVRNITACYLSGICPKENYPVYKIAWGLSEYLLSLDDSLNLPRKFKIAVSGCNEDCAFCGVNDVGIVAQDGGIFKVVIGGGMGAKSAVGRLFGLVQLKDIGYVVRAVLNVFNKYGDRKNRHHNRLRFLIEDMGWEKFSQLVAEELERVRENEYIAWRQTEEPEELPRVQSTVLPVGESESEKLFYQNNVFPQKQSGYYYAILRIPLGEMTGEQLVKLADLSSEVPGIIFRTTPRQNLLLSNIPAEKLSQVYHKVKEILSDFLFPDSALDLVCCKGATTCNLGLVNSVGLARDLLAKLSATLTARQLKNFYIHISGCPNACGQLPQGKISFAGTVRKVHGRSVPFYRVQIGGQVAAENTKLARDIGLIPARNVGELMRELLNRIGQQSPENLDEYLNNGGRQLLSGLIEKYSFVPAYEENRSFYIDLGKSEDFSLDGLGQGECGAGVIDMIEADISSGKQALLRAKENNYSSADILAGLQYFSRALLVVKGIDVPDGRSALDFFEKIFIAPGLARERFSDLVAVYQKIAEGKISGEEAFCYLKDFGSEVEEIYKSMDSNFNFPVRAGLEKPEKAMVAEPALTDSPVLRYDLRNTPCPINYVKVKMKLEEIPSGATLEVWLDEGEPIKNVPVSLKNDGHRILEISPKDNFYRLLLQKK